RQAEVTSSPANEGVARPAPLQTIDEPRPPARLIPFNVPLVLPAQLTMLAVVLVPTLIVIWLSVTDWQPTQAIPWWRAEFIWFWNFYDLWYDSRCINAVLRTFAVVAICIGAELGLAFALALLFLKEWWW